LKINNLVYNHGVLDVLGIVHPWYWLQRYFDASFFKHLEAIKIELHYGKLNGWMVKNKGL
jgi:hypothetical protein